MHALQTKVKTITQRRTRGRDRDREKERERLDPDVLVSSPTGQLSSEVFLRQRPRAKGPVPLPALSWRSGAAKNLSSSDEEEEVEVQVRLEIHTPPAEAQREPIVQVGDEPEEEKPANTEGQVSFVTGQSYELRGGTSQESLLSDNSSSSKDEPSPLPPLPVLSCSATTASSSSSTSTTTTRHWAPPKGFWRVARPETLLLNGVGPHSIPSALPLKDYTQMEVAEEPQGKPKAAERGVGEDGDVTSGFKHSDSVERYLDRCEQKEADADDPGKGLCSSDSWESMSSQSGVPSADEKMKVKQRAYAKLRERQQNNRDERDLSGGESERETSKTDSKGRSQGK